MVEQREKKKKDSRNQNTIVATALHSANTLDAQCRSIVAAQSFYYKTFIFSCGWLHAHILLFYFDL